MAEELNYKTVWDTLSKVDVSDHTEKKMNLTYLSWAWAWGVLMEHYPEAKYSFYEDDNHVPFVTLPDGTCEVRCRVSIGDLVREMWLPIMNHKNQPVINPNSFQVNTSKMRCLTKCLGMWGLGHYIYAGEDLPEGEPKEAPKKKTLEPLKVGDPNWKAILKYIGANKDKTLEDIMGMVKRKYKVTATVTKGLTKAVSGGEKS